MTSLVVASSAGIFILPFVGGLILFAIIRVIVRVPGQTLQQKFVRTNPLRGKSEDEIVARVGPPNARSAQADGYLLQWQATGYHIALKFGPDRVCVGVTHEHRA